MKLVFLPSGPLTTDQQQRIQAALAELAAVDNELMAQSGQELLMVRDTTQAGGPQISLLVSKGPFTGQLTAYDQQQAELAQRRLFHKESRTGISTQLPSAHTTPSYPASTGLSPAPTPESQLAGRWGY